jgi:hypothetical protein
MSDTHSSEKELSSHTDPKIIGPGGWSAIHVGAINAKTLEEKKDFIKWMKKYCETFRCHNCSQHCTKYIKEHPLEDFIDEDVGMFRWSWLFHNAVNSRLGKNQVDWDTAYNMYTDPNSMICFKCGDKEGISEVSNAKSGDGSDTLHDISRKAPNLIQVTSKSKPSNDTKFKFVSRH